MTKNTRQLIGLWQVLSVLNRVGKFVSFTLENIVYKCRLTTYPCWKWDGLEISSAEAVSPNIFVHFVDVLWQRNAWQSRSLNRKKLRLGKLKVNMTAFISVYNSSTNAEWSARRHCYNTHVGDMLHLSNSELRKQTFLGYGATTVYFRMYWACYICTFVQNIN